jgi:hypothetical protein
MKRLFTILLLIIPFFGWSAGRFTLGSGSGTVSLTSMSGHSPGDTAAIVAGSYSSATFSNLTGIVIIPNTTVVTFTGGITVSKDSLCQWLGNTIPGTTYGFVTNGASTGWTFSGTMYGMRVWNWDFENVTGNCFDLSATVVTYDQANENTKLLRHSTFGNIKANSCAQLMQGTFGEVSAVVNVVDSIQFFNLELDSLNGGGIAISGTGFYRLVVNGCKIIGNNPGASHDVGYFFISGNCFLANITRNGGFGYILRIVTASLNNTPIASYLVTSIDANSQRYGTFDVRSGLGFGGDTYIGQNGLAGGDMYCLNVTSGNKKDTMIGGQYTTCMGIIEDMAPYGEAHMMNCFSYNTFQIQSGHNMLQVNTADPVDTANNIYWPTANQNLKDSTTTWMPLAAPLLPLNSGGTNESAVYTTDINGVAWGGTYGRGAVKYVSQAIINALVFPHPVTLKQGP